VGRERTNRCKTTLGEFHNSRYWTHISYFHEPWWTSSPSIQSEDKEENPLVNVKSRYNLLKNPSRNNRYPPGVRLSKGVPLTAYTEYQVLPLGILYSTPNPIWTWESSWGRVPYVKASEVDVRLGSVCRANVQQDVAVCACCPPRHDQVSSPQCAALNFHTVLRKERVSPKGQFDTNTVLTFQW